MLLRLPPERAGAMTKAPARSREMITPPPTLPDAPSTATSFPFNGVPS